jgi:hypothetical protein
MDVVVEQLARGRSGLVWCLVGVMLAICGYYIPLPLTQYPDDPEFRRSIASTMNLMMLGVQPWVLAVTGLFAFYCMRSDVSGNQVIPNPTGKASLSLTTVIGIIWALVLAKDFYYWRAEPLSTFDLLVPVVSLTSMAFLLWFAAKLTDVPIPGWGFWILLSSISVSSVGLTIVDWRDAIRAGAATGRDAASAIAFVALSIVFAMLAVYFCRNPRSSAEKHLLFFSLAIPTAVTWLIFALNHFFSHSSSTAIYLEEHRQSVAWTILATVLAISAIGWLRVNCTFKLAALFPFAALAPIIIFDRLEANSKLSAILQPSDYVFISIAIFATYDLLTYARKQGEMRGALKPSLQEVGE